MKAVKAQRAITSILSLTGALLIASQAVAATGDFQCNHPRYKDLLKKFTALRSGALDALTHADSLIDEVNSNSDYKKVPQDRIDYYASLLTKAQDKVKAKLSDSNSDELKNLLNNSIAPNSDQEKKAASEALLIYFDGAIENNSLSSLDSEMQRLTLLAMSKSADPNEALAPGIAQRFVMKKSYESVLSKFDEAQLGLLKSCTIASQKDGTDKATPEDMKGAICIKTDRPIDRISHAFSVAVTTTEKGNGVSFSETLGVFEAKRAAYGRCEKAGLSDCEEIDIKCQEPKFFGIYGLTGKTSRTCTSTVRGYEIPAASSTVSDKKCTNFDPALIDALLNPNAGASLEQRKSSENSNKGAAESAPQASPEAKDAAQSSNASAAEAN
jgi:hypothetical protein